MQLKANLHFHSSEDPHDTIDYSLYEGIDEAARLGFDVLASTCHNKCAATNEHVEYAKRSGILLIPGIELTVYDGDKAAHVLVLNCSKDIEAVSTLPQLTEYKKEHPEIFIIAAHPYHIGNFSLHYLLEEFIDIFDGIEHSWFYSRWFDRNKLAEYMSKKYNKPYIATSDTHYFDFLNESYTTVDAEEKTIESFFDALRWGHLENTTSPRKFFTEMFLKTALFVGRSKLMRARRRLTPAYALVEKKESNS